MSLDLIRVCAIIEPSKWEDIGLLLLSPEDLNNVHERCKSKSNFSLMIMVLHTWNVAESPTVGSLLEWFHRVGVNRHDIKMKYANWFGSKQRSFPSRVFVAELSQNEKNMYWYALFAIILIFVLILILIKY